MDNFLKNMNPDKLKDLSDKIYRSNFNNDSYWEYILSKPNIDINFIIDNLYNINPLILIKLPILDKVILDNNIFIEKVIENNLLNELIKHHQISTKLIIEHENSIDWNLVCQYQNLEINFIESHIDKLNWDLISEYQLLTPLFICQHTNNINWKLLCSNYKSRYLFTEDFIKLFSHKNVWNAVLWSDNISDDFIIEFYDKINIKELIKYKCLSQKLINYIVDHSEIDNKLIDLIIENQIVNYDFIKKFKQYINYDLLSAHQNLDYDFIEQNRDKISLKQLSYNEYFNEELLKKIYINKDDYKDDFDWDFISQFVDVSPLTAELIKEINLDIIVANNI